jgi:ATP-binding protein involved in chromosome partitioning
MLDPRLSIIDKRLSNIRTIIAISGAKGGVGKSLTAATLALLLAKKGRKVGLLDLDFTSPSTHIILGVEDLNPKEEDGIIPPQIRGIKYMSIVYFSKDNPTPLRGTELTNSFLELLAITQWGELDYLLIDMPPGIGDATLDVIRFIKGIRFLIIVTPSSLALLTVIKLLDLLKSINIPIIGVIENMKTFPRKSIKQEIKQKNVIFLGSIPFDKELEGSIGKPEQLINTRFALRLYKILKDSIV